MQDIINYLGGKRFALFTGSTNFEPVENGIKMELANNKSNATHLFITKQNKTYEMLFYEITPPRLYIENNKFIPGKNRIVADIKNVQPYDLITIFTEITGIYTKFC